MIRDIGEMVDHSNIEADICIIGGGAAAITMAKNFIGTGANVAILEGGDLGVSDHGQKLASGKVTGVPYFELTETSHRVLGGNTFRWGARTSPLKNIDFKKRDWLQQSGWPISRSDLDPYYEQVFKLIGLSSPFKYEGDVWDQFAVNPPEFNTDSFAPCGFQFGKNILFGEVFRRDLSEAENINVYLNATVQTIDTDDSGKHITSVSIRHPGGKKFTAKAKRFVLACGGIENARLLLSSNRVHSAGLCNENDLVGRYFMEHPTVNAGKILSENLQNLHDLFSPGLVGGRLVEIGLGLSEDFQKKHGCLNAVARTSIVVAEDSTQALRDIVWNMRHRRMPHQLKWYRDNKWLGQRVGAILRDPFSIVTNAYRHAVGKPKRFKIDSVYLEVRSEQEPNVDSRVKLSDDKDQFGSQRAHLHWDLTSRDRLTVKATAEAFNSELQRLGMGALEIADWLKSDDLLWPEELVGGHHHMGTTRMSVDSNTGVVDANCRAHSVDNLYIASSSVFPSSGYVNPTSTILALSLRLADHLKRELL